MRSQGGLGMGEFWELGCRWQSRRVLQGHLRSCIAERVAGGSAQLQGVCRYSPWSLVSLES